MHKWWDSPFKNTWTKFMTKSHFLQICSVLNFSDNSDTIVITLIHMACRQIVCPKNNIEPLRYSRKGTFI